MGEKDGEQPCCFELFSSNSYLKDHKEGYANDSAEKGQSEV